MLERDDLTYKCLRIRCWRHEPAHPAGTVLFLPGFETQGRMYEAFLAPFADRRILLPEFSEGSHPVTSVLDAINLTMTLYRHKGKEIDLSLYDLIGYSLGGLVAAHLAADDCADHPAPRSLIVINPAHPGQRTMEYYERQFIAMGTRLRFGAEGESGRRFAKEHGLAFAYRVLANYGRSKALLESINTATLQPSAVRTPTLALVSDDDEFFPAGATASWLERTCAQARIARIAGSHARILHDPAEAQREVRRFHEERPC